MTTIVILTLAACAAYSFEVVFGLAGTVLLIAGLGFYVDPRFLVVYSLMPQVSGQLIALVATPIRLDRKVLLQFGFSASLGAALGFWLFGELVGAAFMYVLAGVIIASGVFMVLSPSNIRLYLPMKLGLDFISGVGGVLYGISGPTVATRMMATFEDKTAIRNHSFVIFLFFNLARLLTYFYNHSFTEEVVTAYLASAPFVIAAQLLANRVHLRVNQALFRKVVALMVLLGGILLLLR